MIRVAHAEVTAYLSTFYESNHLNRILHALTRPPLRTTLRIIDPDADAAAIASELAKHVPAEFSPRVHSEISHCLVLPLRDERGTVPRLARQLIVDRGCGAAVMRGAHVFAPGVMATSRNLSVGESVSVFVDVDGALNRGAFLDDDDKSVVGKCEFVGNGVISMPRRAMFAPECAGIAVQMVAPVFRTPALGGVLADRVFLQNEESMVAVLALDPQPGERVLDMCAAPGGKTSHIASLMRRQGSVLAVDRSQAKCERLVATCERFAATNVSVVVADATKLQIGGEYDAQRVDESGVRRRERVRIEQQFDRVLLDAPCSALGQRPRFEIEAPLRVLQFYAVYQRKLLRTACALLRPGGRLVYSTCSLLPDENEANVQFILNAEPELELVAALPKIGDDAIAADRFGLSAAQARLVQRFDPSSERTDGIAFFIACFEKKRRSRSAGEEAT